MQRAISSASRSGSQRSPARPLRCHALVSARYRRHPRRAQTTYFFRRRADGRTGILRDDTLIVSNTSSLPLYEVAAGLRERARFAGWHVLFPAHQTRVIEIVAATETAPPTMETLFDLATRMGKQPIVVRRAVHHDSAAVHGALFSEGTPERRSLAKLKQRVAVAVRRKHARGYKAASPPSRLPRG